MNMIHGVLNPIGAVFLGFLAMIGRITIFAGSTIRHMFTPPFYPKEYLRAFLHIGYYSLSVVGLTAIFTGGALVLQIYLGSSNLNAKSVTPFIAALAIVRELGPVLGGLMVAGRVSSSIAAEIATMRVTEQIDALRTLSTNPMKYLVAPRVLIATLVMPILVLVNDILGIFGGYAVATSRLGFSSSEYLRATVENLEFWDVGSGLIKAAVFGFILALMGCYHGYHSDRGAQGVGRATTYAVVSASVLILAANYILTELFFSA